MNKRKGAFTLIELLVTMSLMAILFAISAPVFGEFQKSSNLKSSSQMIETAFGEAFSGARSRSECFIVSSNENLAGFSLNSYPKNLCERDGEEILSREFILNSGVKFKKSFKTVFRSPFGDMEFFLSEVGDSMDIEICNDECVVFQVNKKSGLFSRITNQEEDE